MKIVNELNKKMIFLTRELEELNRQMKSCDMQLHFGDSTLLDSIKTEKKKSETQLN